MMKQEKNVMKREDKSKTVQRIALIEEYKKEKSLESLLVKTSRADEIRYLLHYKDNKRQNFYGKESN